MKLYQSTYSVAVTTFAALCAGCASTRIKHLDAEAFLRNAEMAEQPNSALSVTYLGASRGRAYLEYQNLLTLSGKPKTVVFWTELGGLPKDIADQLRSGEAPWVPWHRESGKDGTTEPATPLPKAVPSGNR